MVRKKMRYSLFEDAKRSTDKAYKYESSWGTRAEQRSKPTISVQFAKHPLMTWAQDIRGVFRSERHTDAERAAIQLVIEEIDVLGDFEGVRQWTVDSPTLGMQFVASMLRLPHG